MNDKNTYKNMNGGGILDIFKSKKDDSLLIKFIEEILPSELQQLKDYLVVPENLKDFFKKIYLPQQISNPTDEREKGQNLLYNFVNKDIDEKIKLTDRNIPEFVEIPRKK